MANRSAPKTTKYPGGIGKKPLPKGKANRTKTIITRGKTVDNKFPVATVTLNLWRTTLDKQKGDQYIQIYEWMDATKKIYKFKD